MTEVRTLSIDSEFGGAQVLRGLGYESEPVVVAGKIELIRRIGSGGQGTVYEGLDRDLDRRVAVKVLELGDPDEAKREGQALAKLEHPNVVRIYEHGRGDDYRYYVLELLDGPTLREWCADKSPEEIVVKYAEAARGLEAAHAAGLVHRDFKPSNVRIGSGGKAVVVDFGLARNLRTLESDSEERGVVAGTLAYTAPERLLGRVGDERSDQFSLCVALWEALCGINPFGPCDKETTSAGRYHAIQGGRRGTPRGAKHVVKALERGLSLHPHQRFTTVGELVDALLHKPKRRIGWVEVAVGVVALAMGTALVIQLLPDQPPSPPWLGNHIAAFDAEAAVARAVVGDDQGALQVLENAQHSELSPGDSKIIATAGRRVAVELDRQGKWSEAGVAWTVTIMLARQAGDADLEREIDREWQDFLTRFAQTRNR